ncbi:hypothetical protein TNCV_4378111 [Trichonephila clavipes]|nr:hypothetical protein TNCV_4378111 [Trichonephila clavipes]
MENKQASAMATYLAGRKWNGWGLKLLVTGLMRNIFLPQSSHAHTKWSPDLKVDGSNYSVPYHAKVIISPLTATKIMDKPSKTVVLEVMPQN